MKQCTHAKIIAAIDAIGRKTAGQCDYEADVRWRPTYPDGTPRKSWDQLDNLCRWSWERKYQDTGA